MQTLTEENFLKVIFQITEEKKLKASTNFLAENLNISAASVSDTLRKLSDKELINYEKYQAVTLSAKGRDLAIQIIRKHRLWEVFLVEKLDFNWNEVHDIAEQLEHINSEELIVRLDKYLNYPHVDPHGDLIPDKEGNFKEVAFRKLTEITEGAVIMAGILDHSPSFLKYLDKIGFGIGVKMEVIEVFEYDRSVLISITTGTTVSISYEVAKNILVK